MPTRILLITVALATLGAFASQTLAQQDTSLRDFIGQLNDNDSEKRREAAEDLARTVDRETILQPILAQLQVETDTSVKLALNYAAACQGEKSHVQPLIESLNRSGHFGFIYLRHATGQDFGWNADYYQNWFDETTDKEYLDFVNERWRRKPMMDEYSEFASLFSKQYFGSMTLVETGELVDPDEQLTDAEKKKLEELPTAKSWRLFNRALTELDDNGDRKAAAKCFETLVSDFPNTFYADQSRELLTNLEKMIKEDDGFELPEDFSNLSLAEQIDIHIFHLRDARAFQFMQPGSCQLSFNGSVTPGDVNYNAAAALVEIGKPANNRLADLLEDRRPIRGVGYWRDFVPARNVLRYSDAAQQILQKIDMKR